MPRQAAQTAADGPGGPNQARTCRTLRSYVTNETRKRTTVNEEDA
jgi:hypothetical protein